MPHSYKFGNAEHTIVVRDDGRILRWPAGTNVGNIDGGRIAEQYRLDDGPRRTQPYQLALSDVPPKVLAVLAAVLGSDDAAAEVVEALFAAGFQLVETPRPCR
jgi:hypothetical protein